MLHMGRFASQEIDGWKVEMEWDEGHYQGGPAGMWIRPVEDGSIPSGGLSSTVLRRIDFRKAKADLHKSLETDPHGWRGSPDAQKKRETEKLERLRDQLAAGISPTYLALLASNYVSRVNGGQPKPVAALAADLGKAPQTIQGHLWQARNQGLLTGSAGRKGGDLTPEAMGLIQRFLREEKRRVPPPQPSRSLIESDPPAWVEVEHDDD
jgi:hypothetical protein